MAGADIYLSKSKKTVLTFSAKINYAGGKRFIPVDLNESEIYHTATYDYDHARYTHRYPDYSRVDIKVGFKLNGKKITQEWAF